MASFAEAQTCRRQILLNYFSEYQREPCGNCDICLNPPKSFDGTLVAQQALSCVYRAEQRFGLGYIVELLRGANTSRIHLRLSYLRNFKVFQNRKIIFFYFC